MKYNPMKKSLLFRNITVIFLILLALDGRKVNAQSCTPPPSSLVSWWRAEGDATDAVGGNNGGGSYGFVQGEVGQAFSMDGQTTYASVGTPANLELQNFTIEAWIKRYDSNNTSLVTPDSELFCFGQAGYGFGIWNTGNLFLTSVGVDNIQVNTGLTDTNNFHHVAVTKSGSSVIFYLDGVAYGATPYFTTFAFNTTAAIGARGDNLNNNFYGAIDELSIYGSALSAAQIQAIYSAGSAGKCVSGPPAITIQPTNAVIGIGSNYVLAVAAAGSPPITFQWSLNGTNIPSATNTTLLLTNLQLASSGTYSVLVSNQLGTASASASVTVEVIAPSLITQPTGSEVVSVGGLASFSVTATGSLPLSYQWWFNSAVLPGATSPSLFLTNVQLSQAGNYYVVVSNAGGTIASSTVYLTVNPNPPCVTVPANMVAWWSAEGNAADIYSGNNGTISNMSFGAGEVGEAFIGNGSNSFVNLGSPKSLQLQNFTIETWIRRFNSSQVSLTESDGTLLCWGNGGYAFGLWSDGRIFLSQADVNNIAVAAGLTDTNNFHHVAVTKSGTTVVFYLDGLAYPYNSAYSSVFTFTTPLAIGADGDDHLASFYGAIDEMSVYSRALSASEIQSIYNAGAGGKCVTAPIISSQPASQTVYPGFNALFQVVASGPYIQYQWAFNGVNIPNATNSSLTISNVTAAQCGSYSVYLTNLLGSAASSNAVLTLLTNCISTASGLADLWSGEGGAIDYVGGNTGTLAGAVTFVPGENGQAFEFNGINATVLIPASANLNLGALNSGMTMECWIKPNDLTDGQALFEWNNGTTFGIQFYINISGTSNLYANIEDTSGNTHLMASASGILNSNAFQHVAATYDPVSGNGVLYYNGAALVTQNLGKFIPQTSYPLALGSEQAHGGVYYYNGIMDEASLYSRALTAAEIHQIYLTGSGRTNCMAPVFLLQPTNLSVFPGSNITLTGAAFGSIPFQYQWQENSINLPGATSPSLTISNVLPSNAGTFSLVVSNNEGVSVSTNAVLTVPLVTAYGNGSKLTNSVYSYSGSVSLSLSNYYSGGYIFYTLDGSTPTPFSSVYSGPIVLSNNAVIRTLAFSVDFTQFAYSSPLTVQVVPSYTLTTSTAGGGTITRSLTNALLLSNTVVTLTAVPSNGWTFLQWQGDLTGFTNSNSVVMVRNKSVQAVFGTSVSNSVGGNGSVVFDPPGNIFPYGFNLQATAVPQPGNVFVLWGNAASGSTNPLSFLVTNANKEISALFSTLGTGQVSLTVEPIGHGQVTVNPRANGYTTGSTVTVTAIPNAGKSFLGWSGGASGTQNPLTVTLNQSKVIYANFTTNYSLSIATLPGGISQGVALTLTGEIGTHYALDSSTDLVNWTPLFNLTNAVGNLYYLDTNTSNFSQKFYQSVILP